MIKIIKNVEQTNCLAYILVQAKAVTGVLDIKGRFFYTKLTRKCSFTIYVVRVHKALYALKGCRGPYKG